jgi:hypothetical protein
LVKDHMIKWRGDQITTVPENEEYVNRWAKCSGLCNDMAERAIAAAISLDSVGSGDTTVTFRDVNEK